MRKPLPALILAALAAALMLAACGTSKSSGTQPVQVLSPAHSVVSSALANPTVSADLSRAESEFLANVQKEYAATPAHPFQAVSRAVRDTWPQGNTAVIAQYAVSTFTPAVLTTSGPGSPRDDWLQGVAARAEANGGSTPVPSAS